MASLESKLFYALLRAINKKNLLNMQFAFGKFDFYQCTQPPKALQRICVLEKHRVNGRNVFTLKPKGNFSGKRILYLHGGAYVQNFVRQHWSFLGELIKSLQCEVIAPDYPLAPRHTWKETFAMLEIVCKESLQFDPSNFILMGDSAGGGLALALAQKMKQDNLPQPGQIILLSPWLDITLNNPDIKNVDEIDPFLGIKGLKKAGKAFAGDTDPRHYLLSPINGTLDGLGKISLFIGSRDLLVADARRFKALAESRGVRINYFEYEGMVHVWMLLNFRESKQAKQQIIELISTHQTAG